jgi:hypothetical protein
VKPPYVVHIEEFNMDGAPFDENTLAGRDDVVHERS